MPFISQECTSDVSDWIGFRMALLHSGQSELPQERSGVARAERNKFTLKTAFLERPPVKSYLWRTKGESLRSILANRFPWLVLPPPTIGRLRLTLANCRFVLLKRRGIGSIESPERGTIVDRCGYVDQCE